MREVAFSPTAWAPGVTLFSALVVESAKEFLLFGTGPWQVPIFRLLGGVRRNFQVLTFPAFRKIFIWRFNMTSKILITRKLQSLFSANLKLQQNKPN